jgi:hypothetical protein
MRSFIHFANNNERAPRNHPNYDPLHKVRHMLNTIMDGIRKVWSAGMNITIDESMIRYSGRAVSWVQYMPAKPIKHGIKVFAACCAYSGVLLAYDVYCGKDIDGRNIMQITIDLLQSANLFSARGRALFTDNYYTSIKLAKELFIKYGWTLCGTITPTDKKTRAGHDVPFCKLSTGAKAAIPRGWYREAVLQLADRGRKFFIQCTTWKDKKQVMFLHTNTIGRSKDNHVRRHVRGQRDRNIIRAPLCLDTYSEWFNAVDRNDRDSADYSTTIRTNRYYILILCWALDRVLHACYVIVCECAKAGIGPVRWKRYLSKNAGRHDFQVELGIALLNCAIEMDWNGVGPKPAWMRQTVLVPCDCKMCYFCLKGLTNGVAHKQQSQTVIHYKCGKRLRVRGCTDIRVRVRNNKDYCRRCYRNHPGVDSDGNKMNAKAKKNECASSYLGCGACLEPICEACWPVYDHRVAE